MKNKIRSQIGTPKCPACNQDFKSNNDNNNNNNLTISPPPYSPIRPLPLNINNRNPFHQRLDILDRLENLSLNDSFDDSDFEGPGLDKNILDNMEIAKIKDVDKLARKSYFRPRLCLS